MVFRWLLFIVFILCLQWYSSNAVKTVTKSSWVYYLFMVFNTLVIVNFILQIVFFRENGLMSPYFSYSFGLCITVMVFQIITISFLFVEDVVRVPQWIYHVFTKGFSKSFEYSPQRREFISKLALITASIPAGSLIFGMMRGKYNYRVINHKLSYVNLPNAFDNFKIVHISDFHCGSFDDAEKVSHGIKMINDQKPDIIFFTGDMVNNIAKELDDWKELIGSLHAPYGKFAVLGNHDYGDYVRWDSEKEKEDNMKMLLQHLKDMGFHVLLNESYELIKDNEKIDLIGVENWGAGGFKKKGDFDIASSKVAKEQFKILLSHDPSHWEQKIINHEMPVELTLSGHTHGMQFGIEIPGWIKWSPVKFRYKYWAGVYEENNQYININRGFGFLAYPGRVGIYPEISVIQLQSETT